MPRVLLLLRHAEAGPATDKLTDFDRSLTAHGRTQAQQAARRLMASGLHPDVLLSSPARRALETGRIVAAEIGGIARITHDPDLYLASAPLLLSAVQRCENAVQTLLLVGHNPGLSELVRELAARALGSDGAAALGLDLAGLCQLLLDAPAWRELGPRAVRTVTLL